MIFGNSEYSVQCVRRASTGVVPRLPLTLALAVWERAQFSNPEPKVISANRIATSRFINTVQ